MSGVAISRPNDERSLSNISIASLSLILAGILAFVFRMPIQKSWEDVTIAFHPSAERAFAYGERHFDARDAEEYDIARSERMFRLAARLDPDTPYVYHELARIEFLRGNFETALQLIDLEIAKAGDTEPNTYYVRGLIEGYMGRYADAANDYSRFVASDPNNWAAINDYAWILLKAGRTEDALAALDRGVLLHADNPWLLNSYTIALYESGRFADAKDMAKRAVAASQKVTASDWLTAYPGNDPKSAASGVAALRSAAYDNMNRVDAALASSTVQ